MVLGGTSLLFWFALTQKLAMLSISSCAYWPCVCLLWRNGYLGLLPIFQLGCLGFVIELYEVSTYLGNEALVGPIICKYFLPVHRLSFHFVYGFICCINAYKFG